MGERMRVSGDLKTAQIAVIEGYAAVFEEADLSGDEIAPGAFQRCLGRKRPQDIKLLYQHASDRPIGRWLTIREDGRGLFVRGQLLLGLDKAREAADLIAEGLVDGLSIGFEAVKASRDGASSGRRLIEVDLWEASVVTFPMAPSARIHSIRFDGEGGGRASIDRETEVQAFSRGVEAAGQIFLT